MKFLAKVLVVFVVAAGAHSVHADQEETLTVEQELHAESERLNLDGKALNDIEEALRSRHDDAYYTWLFSTMFIAQLAEAKTPAQVLARCRMTSQNIVPKGWKQTVDKICGDGSNRSAIIAAFRGLQASNRILVQQKHESVVLQIKEAAAKLK